MVKWLVTLFLALVILAMVTPLFGRISLGRLPGDFRIPLRGRVYYRPTDRGAEKEIAERLAKWRAWREKQPRA